MHFGEDLHDGLLLRGVKVHQLSRVDFFTISFIIAHFQAGCAVPRLRQSTTLVSRGSHRSNVRSFVARCFSGVKHPKEMVKL